MKKHKKIILWILQRKRKTSLRELIIWVCSLSKHLFYRVFVCSSFFHISQMNWQIATHFNSCFKFEIDGSVSHIFLFICECGRDKDLQELTYFNTCNQNPLPALFEWLGQWSKCNMTNCLNNFLNWNLSGFWSIGVIFEDFLKEET